MRNKKHCVPMFPMHPRGIGNHIVRVFSLGPLGTRKNLFGTFVPIKIELDKDCFLLPLILPKCTYIILCPIKTCKKSTRKKINKKELMDWVDPLDDDGALLFL